MSACAPPSSEHLRYQFHNALSGLNHFLLPDQTFLCLRLQDLNLCLFAMTDVGFVAAVAAMLAFFAYRAFVHFRTEPSGSYASKPTKSQVLEGHHPDGRKFGRETCMSHTASAMLTPT